MTGGATNNGAFIIHLNGSTSGLDGLTVDQNGDVGVGTDVPLAKLHVGTDATGNEGHIAIHKAGVGNANLSFMRGTNDIIDARIVLDVNEELNIENLLLDKDINFWINDGGTAQNMLIVDASASKIGVKTATPQGDLHIIGGLAAHELIVEGNGATSVDSPKILINNSHGSINIDNSYGELLFSALDTSADGSGIVNYIKSIAVNAGVSSRLEFGTRTGGNDGNARTTMVLVLMKKLMIWLSKVMNMLE
tara:strand:- start:23635 stop:24381 length:747 start_codon:yes stop_codon:yes gene_type:complete